MTLRKIIITILAITLLLFLHACDNTGKPTGSGGSEDNHNKNPILLSDEALKMSLWYSNNLTPDSSLAIRFQSGLTSLRSQFGDSIPQVDSIHFIYPMVLSEIIFGMTDSAAEQFLDSNYHAWDDLNEEFGLINIRPSLYFDLIHFVVLEFEGYLNPLVLETYYKNLPGCLYIDPNGFVGDWSCIYPWIVDNKVTFLVREAWGDCPAGCINNHFFYFKESGAGIELIGEYIKWDQDLPDWWEEAKMAYDRYCGYY